MEISAINYQPYQQVMALEANYEPYHLVWTYQFTKNQTNHFWAMLASYGYIKLLS